MPRAGSGKRFRLAETVGGKHSGMGEGVAIKSFRFLPLASSFWRDSVVAHVCVMQLEWAVVSLGPGDVDSLRALAVAFWEWLLR